MNYQECQLIVDSTKDIFTSTEYAVEYYLDGEPYFTLNGEYVEYDELPEDLKSAFNNIIDTLEIEF